MTGPAPLRVYYDGSCGLCHRFVRFVLARDRGGDAARFAPLDGETFRARVDPGGRAALPDSVVVEGADGALLTRSDGVIAVLARLPGPWPAAGRLLGRIPRRWRDAGYDAVARARRRIFAPPAGSCPVPPGALRGRFDP